MGYIYDSQNWPKLKGCKTPTVVIYDEHIHLSHWGQEAINRIAEKKDPNDIVLKNFIPRFMKPILQKKDNLMSDDTIINDMALFRATVEYLRLVFYHILVFNWDYHPDVDCEFLQQCILLVHFRNEKCSTLDAGSTINYFRVIFTQILDQISCNQSSTHSIQYSLDYIDKYVNFIIDQKLQGDQQYDEEDHLNTTIAFFYDVYTHILHNINLARSEQHKEAINIKSITDFISENPNIDLPEIMYQGDFPTHDTFYSNRFKHLASDGPKVFIDYFSQVFYNIFSQILDSQPSFYPLYEHENTPFCITQNSWLNKKDEGATDTRAFIDFFRAVHHHIINQIHSSTPVKIRLSSNRIIFVISVPNIWNETQRAAIHNIIKATGVLSKNGCQNRLKVIDNSLAAALYCEREIAHKNLEENTNYIICDVGGCNARITSYVATTPEIENYNASRCQISSVIGEQCGSTYIDKRMEEFLMKVLFRPDDIQYTAKEMRELDIIIAELLTQFNGEGGSKVKVDFNTITVKW